MKKQSSPVRRASKSGRFVLTSNCGEKISAVEGMKLSPRMDLVLKQSAHRTGDERRALIRETVRKK
ncbi:MAG TPA: hypothetical protein VHI52_09070 [Verrucomicrobiae bacterium]|nr:hypothetical protein [Verrucomicrobiae bacterium]